MRLAEALRASKIREAIGYLKMPTGLSVIVALADDSGITSMHPETLGWDAGERRAWGDLLPATRRGLAQIVWRSIDEKSPLTQLAESVDDWIEYAED